MEQKDRTSREAPTTPPVDKARSSSSLSDASDAHKPANATPAVLSPHAQNLLRDSEHHVRQLAERHGLPWNPGVDNTVAAVARHARDDGLTGINHFNVKDGSNHARVAANTPEAVSLRPTRP